MPNPTKKALWVMTSLALGFLAGTAIDGRYVLLREMQMQAEVMARNGPILASCKAIGCDKNIQKILVGANDAAMQQLLMLESGSIVNRAFYYIAWPSILFVYSNSTPPSSEEIKRLYQKLGCGLNGVLCKVEP